MKRAATKPGKATVDAYRARMVETLRPVCCPETLRGSMTRDLSLATVDALCLVAATIFLAANGRDYSKAAAAALASAAYDAMGRWLETRGGAKA